MEHYITWTEFIAFCSFLVLFANMISNLSGNKKKTKNKKKKKK